MCRACVPCFLVAADGAVAVWSQGDKGKMGETRLENARSNFSRNAVDVFEVGGCSDVQAVERGCPTWLVSTCEPYGR